VSLQAACPGAQDGPNRPHVVVDSTVDQGCIVPLVVVDPTKHDPAVLRRWLSSQTDNLAAEVLAQSQEGLSPKLRELASALLLRKIKAVRLALIDDIDTAARLDTIETQAEHLRLGNTVDAGRLRDLRFGSLFAPQPKRAPAAARPPVFAQRPMPPKAVVEEAHFERPPPHYSRAVDRDDRTPLQTAICAVVDRRVVPPSLQELIDSATDLDILASDSDGNTALHLAAYCGHDLIVNHLLAKHKPTIDLELCNGIALFSHVVVILQLSFSSRKTYV
jgi:hypothetical protein